MLWLWRSGDKAAVVSPMRAEAFSRKTGCIGAVVFSTTGDPGSGEFGDALRQSRSKIGKRRRDANTSVAPPSGLLGGWGRSHARLRADPRIQPGSNALVPQV